MFSDSIEKKRKIILWCSVCLYFFCSMNKVLLPGTMYNEIQSDFSLNADKMASLGAGFMYSYALSQFFLGIFSDRFGGVRLLLFGGIIFTIGTIGTFFSHVFCFLLFMRIAAGFGAGVCYVGVAKLITELYNGKFLWIFTSVMVIGFLGPVTGGLPMSILVQHTSWRLAMLLPMFAAILIMFFILLHIKDTMFPIRQGNNFSELKNLFRKKENLALFFSVSVLSGSHYTLSSLIGKKCLEDTGSFSASAAATWVTVMLIIVAADNIFGNILLKFIHGRCRLFMIGAAVLGFIGPVLGWFFFSFGGEKLLIETALVCIAIPAGYFPVYCLIAKELNPPENAGLALSMLNFISFATVAIEQQLTGCIIRYYEKSVESYMYSLHTYANVFLMLSIFAFTGLLCAFIIPKIEINKF